MLHKKLCFIDLVLHDGQRIEGLLVQTDDSMYGIKGIFIVHNEFGSINLYDWFGKVINWELYKKIKIRPYYMHKPEPFPEKEMHKIIRDFEIQTDHLIPSRRTDLEKMKKRKKKILRNSGFCRPGAPQNKNQRN